MKESREPLPAKLTVEILGAILSTGLFAFLRYLLGNRLDSLDEIALLLAGGVLSFLLFHWGFIPLVRHVIERILEPRLREKVIREESARIAAEAKAEARRELATMTGIEEIFLNFRHCEKEILEALTTSSAARVFLQIGRTVLAGNTSFYDLLGDTVKTGHVKLLHAADSSPYLSERVAYQRGSRFHVWQADLDHAVKKVEALGASPQKNIDARQHKEGYVWRLFVTDNYAYVQPYLFERDNSEQAPVLKISRLHENQENPKSLYHAFTTYFDQKWEENTPHTDRLERIIPEGATCAVAGVIRYHQFYIFAIPKRYIARSGRDLPFHGIGGKRRPRESYAETLQREAAEELGAQLEIDSASRTRFFTTNAQFSSLPLADLPKPWCVYKRSRETDPNFEHIEVLWLLAYEAKIKIDSLESLHPAAEIGALVVVTGDLLRKTTHETVTYESLGQLRDGSRVIIAQGVTFDRSRRAVPTGVAALVAAEQTPRLLYSYSDILC